MFKKLVSFAEKIVLLLAILSIAGFAIASSALADDTASPTPAPTPVESAAPQPSATPDPSTTPTPAPSSTPDPSASPTPAPSSTPVPSTDPSPSPSATPTPTIDPSPTPASSSTPAPSSTPSPSASPTISTISVGTTYSAPTNSNVKVKFTSVNGTAGSLDFNEYSLSSAQTTQLQALSSTVYGMTSSMPNGSFTYDLTLPYPSGVSGTNFKVLYASDVNGLSNGTQVSQTITDNGDGTFTIHGLNHFTVFVVVNPNSQANCDGVTLGTTPGSTCFTTVQAAVNAAANGDTINIGSTGSPYNETVYVNKQLTIQGSGNPSVTAFVLQTTPVTITGITTSVSIATPSVSLTNPVNSGNQTNVTISGTGAANATVNYTIAGTSGSVPGTGTVSSSGTINITGINVSTLPEGALTLTVHLTSGSYSSSNDTASSFKDTVAPAAATGLTITHPINNANKTAVAISGTAEAGATANYSITSSGGGTAVSGTASVNGSGSWSVSGLNVSGLGDGTLTLSVTVTDTAGNTSTASTTTATKDTVPPTVSAGPSVSKNATFTTTATASDPAPSSGIASYTWTQVSGPGTITFGTPSTLNTTVSANTDGAYVLQLVVTDVAGNSTTSTFTLTWDTVPPVISGLTNATTNTTVTRTATVTDPAPSSGIASYAWSQVSGPGTITFGSATSTSTTLSANVDGTYSVKFTATDAAGNSSNQTITFVWDTTNPVVSAGTTPQIKNALFTQTGSATDATSGVASTVWSQVSGPGTITFGSVNSTTTTISASADGAYVIQLTATDNAGNTATSTFNLTWDTVPPTVSAGANETRNALFTQTGTVTDPAPSSGISTTAWSQVSGPGVVTFSSPNTLTTNISASVDGVYVIKLTATDNAGNSNNATFTLTWDTTPPTVSAGANETRNALFTQTGSATDATSGVASTVWSQVSGPGTITFGTPSALTTTISASLDGTYVIKLTATDNAGNSNNATFTLTWDTTPPTVSAGTYTPQKAIFTTTATASDATSGIASYAWTQVSGPGTITFGTPATLNTTVSASVDGTYTVKLTVTDNAGNSNFSNSTFVWDTTNPVVSAGTAPSPQNALFTQTGTATDATSGVASTVWSQVSGPGTVTFGTPNSTTTTISASLDGTYTVKLTATDNAGNSSNSTVTFIWDTTSPSVPTGLSTTSPTNSTTQVWTWTASTDATSGIQKYEYSLDGGATFTSVGNVLTLTTNLTQGSHTLLLRAVDNANNPSSTTSFTLLVDTSNPTISSVTLTNTTTGNNSFVKNGDSVTLTATVTDNNQSLITVSMITANLSALGGGAAVHPVSYNTTTGLATWAAIVVSGTGNGVVTITVNANDVANNPALAQTVTPTADNIVPTIPGTPSTTTPTGSTIQVWNWTASTDAGSGINHYEVSVDSGAFTAIGNVLTYTTNLTQGTHTLAVRAVDNAGNISSTSASGSVVMDTTGPTGSWTTPTANTTVSGNGITLTVTATDNLTGVASVTFLYKRNDGIDTFHTITTLTSSPYTTTWNASGLALDNYTLRVTLVDGVGNSTNVDQTVGLATVISQSSIQTSNVNNNGVTISWTTADPTGSRVIYDTVSHPTLGSAPDYGYASSTANFDTSPKVTNHSVTLTGLLQATVYYYRVVSHGSPEAVSSEFSFTTASQSASSGAGSSAGGVSAPSCTDIRPGSAAVLLSVRVTADGQVTLVWQKASDPVTHYQIEYGLGHDQYQYGVPYTGNVTSFVINSLTAGQTYYFRVIAINNCAPADPSNEMSVLVGGVSAAPPGVISEAVSAVSNLLGATSAYAAAPEIEASPSGMEASASATPSAFPSETPRPFVIPTEDNKSKLLIAAGLALLLGGAYYMVTRSKRV